jgi:tRNA(fMet)-specific endonuclease VapC
MLFDTEFVISLSRGEQSASRQRADAFLAQHSPPRLYASRVSWAEVAEGCATVKDNELFFDQFAIVEVDAQIAWIASRIARVLKGKGQHVGDNDIWIAATALVFGLPLVSNNARHFGRVPGLKLLAY